MQLYQAAVTIYVTGIYGNLNSQSNNGDKDAFLVKYNSTGQIQWTRLMENSGTDEAEPFL